MARQPLPISDEKIRDLVHGQGLSYKAAGEVVGLSEAGIQTRLKRMGETRHGADFEKWLPEGVRPHHQAHQCHRMLRAAARREAGTRMSVKLAQELELFEQMLTAGNLVVVYSPDEGYSLQPRAKGEEGWLRG